MKTIKFSLMFVVLSVVYCCTTNQVDDSNSYGEQDLKFQAYQDSEVITRKVGNTWQKDDKIGIYAYESGKSLSQATVESELYNREFINSGGDQFTVVAGTPSVKYPTEGKYLDFVAYYPYSSQGLLQDFIYPINIAEQSDIDKIDFLYSDNLKNVGGKPIYPRLIFKHKLAKLKLSITSKSYNLEGAKVLVKGVPTEADFNLVKGTFLPKSELKDITAYTVATANTIESSALIIPDSTPTAITINIILSNGQVFIWRTPNDWGWPSNTTYTKHIALEPDGSVDPQPKVSYLEYPTVGNLTNRQMIVMHMDPQNTKQRNYSMFYDKDLKFAYWVAYPHHSYYLGSTKRTDAWQYDPKIDRNDQVNLKTSYKESFDRGHQIPSGDRTSNREINTTTFYYSNMTPQVGPGLNQSVWANLENKIRDWVQAQNDTIYVVTGAGLYDKNKIEYAHSKSGEKAAIPDYYYKTLLKKVNGQYQTIGFFFENKNSEKDFNKYRKTVKEIEGITGFTFYPGLPDPKVKEVINGAYWN